MRKAEFPLSQTKEGKLKKQLSWLFLALPFALGNESCLFQRCTSSFPENSSNLLPPKAPELLSSPSQEGKKVPKKEGYSLDFRYSKSQGRLASLPPELVKRIGEELPPGEGSLLDLGFTCRKFHQILSLPWARRLQRLREQEKRLQKQLEVEQIAYQEYESSLSPLEKSALEKSWEREELEVSDLLDLRKYYDWSLLASDSEASRSLLDEEVSGRVSGLLEEKAQKAQASRHHLRQLPLLDCHHLLANNLKEQARLQIQGLHLTEARDLLERFREHCCPRFAREGCFVCFKFTKEVGFLNGFATLAREELRRLMAWNSKETSWWHVLVRCEIAAKLKYDPKALETPYLKKFMRGEFFSDMPHNRAFEISRLTP